MTACLGVNFLSYEQPKELENYLQEFKSAASERGYDLKIPKKLKVKLVDSIDGKNTTKGFCVDDIPMVIRLEKEYWEEADAIQKKILLYHEFGHCFLNRTHTNDILPNGEWKSLMRGGALPNNRSYVINFRGFRKDYYLDELFDPKTSIPAWATRSQKLNADADTFSEITNLSALETLSQNWAKPDSSYADYSINHSSYTIENLSDQKLAVTSVDVPVTSAGNFIIDSKVGLTLSNAEEGIGLMFGKRDSLEYIAITPRLGLKLGNLSQFRPYATIPLNSNAQKEWHRITIQKKQEELLYFLNGELVYHKSARQFAADSLYIGFYVAPHNILEIAHVKIIWK